jgi:small subunit ribosomal protein S17
MACSDPRCAEHGSISVRGGMFVGKVRSAKAPKTAIVERELIVKIPKYERYKKIRARVYAHNPECINAKENDIVMVGETRKLSKTKSFVILKLLGRKEEFRALEEAKAKPKRKEKAEKEGAGK